MTVRTRSVLFGVHNIFVHPLLVGEMPESPLKVAAPVQPTLRRLPSFDNFRFRGRQGF